MSLRRLLLRIVDPAGARFEQREPVRSVHRAAVVFGPGEPLDGRPPTAAELGELKAVAAAHAADRDAAAAEALPRWRPQLEAAADRLLAGEPVALRLGGRAMQARIIRFWHGDSLLQITTEGATSASRSRTRIPRDPRRLGRGVLVHYLVEAVADE
jgi:hypothetical protein